MRPALLADSATLADAYSGPLAHASKPRRERRAAHIARRGSTLPRTETLSIELLETFYMVVKHDGDAAQAARALHINQPSMSKRLSRLKTPSGKFPWLERNGKTWRPTPVGDEVYPVIEAMLDQHRSLNGYAAGRAPLNSLPFFRFACGQTAATQLVPDAVSNWRNEALNVLMRVTTTRSDEELIKGVASGALDMALVALEPAVVEELSGGLVVSSHLVDYGFAAACWKESEHADEFEKLPPMISIKALTPFPLIAPEPASQTREVLDQTIERRHLTNQMKIVVETGGWLTILQHVRKDTGIGIISEAGLPMDENDAKDLIIRRITPKDLPPQHLRLLQRRDKPLSPPRNRPGNTPTRAEVAASWEKALIKSRNKHLRALRPAS